MRRLLLGLALASVTAFASNAVQAGDQEIATHIEQKLRDASKQGKLKNFSLDLQVSKGVVWFKGDVASKEQERLILTTAQRAKDLGVVKIIDEISVATAADISTQQIAKKPVLKPTAPPAPVVAPIAQATEQVAQAQAPQPVAQAPQPVAQAPQPVAQAPQPVAQTPQPVAQTPQPVAQAPQPVASQPVATTQPVGTGARTASQPHDAVQSQQAAQAYYANQRNAYQQVRQTANYAGNQVVAPAQQMPLAQQQMRAPQQSRPVARVAQNTMPMMGGGQANLQAPNYMPVSERRAAAQYDHPQMPNYSWPSYAPHPNYGAVTYPKQYSPSAWPYIGPFYPYPQVPLGWRKVTMEWDDGWWFLDFHDH